MNLANRNPSEAAMRLIAVLPDKWQTEDEIGELAVAHKIGDARPLASVLNEMRRRSWLIRDTRQTPVTWKRTPTGGRIAQQTQQLV